MTVYPDVSITEPLPREPDPLAVAEARIAAGLRLAATLEAEASYPSADRRVDVGVVAHRIRVALGLVVDTEAYRALPAEGRAEPPTNKARAASQ